MEDKFKQFFDAHNEQFLEVSDPTNPNQCMDLAFGWTDLLGVPRDCIGHLYAYQIWKAPSDDAVKYFDFIPNTPNGMPICGDIVVFSNQSPENPNGFGIAGHVCVASGQNTNNVHFESFDQNWGVDKKCHLVSHSYDGVLGWLRLKTPPQVINIPIQINDQTNIPLGKIGEVEYGSPELQALRSILLSKDNWITSHGSTSSSTLVVEPPQNAPQSPTQSSSDTPTVVIKKNPKTNIFQRILDFFNWLKQ